MARATRSLIEPVGFWLSSLTKSWHGPVSIWVISTNGLSPISERIAGGLSWEIVGAEEVWIISKILVDLRLPFVRPFGLAVLEKLLQDCKTDLAVVQSVTKIAAFVDPSRWKPRERQTRV